MQRSAISPKLSARCHGKQAEPAALEIAHEELPSTRRGKRFNQWASLIPGMRARTSASLTKQIQAGPVKEVRRCESSSLMMPPMPVGPGAPVALLSKSKRNTGEERRSKIDSFQFLHNRLIEVPLNSGVITSPNSLCASESWTQDRRKMSLCCRRTSHSFPASLTK